MFLAGLLLFIVVRRAVVPASFGQYGHYRGAVLEEVRKTPVRFAGQQNCGGCHDDVIATRAKSKHRAVSCEACHGAAAAHVADSDTKPVKPDVAKLCAGCHEADAAKPKWFQQVNTKEHSGGTACNGCHQAHSPKL